MTLRYSFFANAMIAVQLICTPMALNAKDHIKFDIGKINSELKRSPLDPRLNYLAGLAYERVSEMGTDQRDMAQVGYLMALKSDPTFWPADVQLGFMAMDDRNAVTAQKFFSAAAAIKADEPIIYYALARAAFCAGDLQVAEQSWKYAIQLRAPHSIDELTTGAAIERHRGAVGAADSYVAKIKQMTKAVPVMALQGAAPSDQQDMSGEANTSTLGADEKMGMVDVIMLRIDEDRYSSSGINLLDALKLQFGANLVNSSWQSSRDRLAGAASSSTSITSGSLSVTVPSVTYSLNIANAGGGKSTIQAQQAVLIYDGEKNSAHIGSTLTFATEGGLSSSVSTLEDGLQLEIDSKFVDQDRVKMTIDASLEMFLPGAGIGSFNQSVQKDKTSTHVTATLKFGETILISSGEQSLNERATDQTPLLGSVPILGKLFSLREKAVSGSSMMVLLTLRPRGSIGLYQSNAVERRNIENMRRRLLDQLGTGRDDVPVKRFKPDQAKLLYRLDNPARSGDKSYLARAGVLDVL